MWYQLRKIQSLSQKTNGWFPSSSLCRVRPSIRNHNLHYPSLSLCVVVDNPGIGHSVNTPSSTHVSKEDKCTACWWTIGFSPVCVFFCSCPQIVGPGTTEDLWSKKTNTKPVASTLMELSTRRRQGKKKWKMTLLVTLSQVQDGKQGWHHAKLQLPQEARMINPLTKTAGGMVQMYSPVAGKAWFMAKRP